MSHSGFPPSCLSFREAPNAFQVDWTRSADDLTTLTSIFSDTPSQNSGLATSIKDLPPCGAASRGAALGAPTLHAAIPDALHTSSGHVASRGGEFFLVFPQLS